MDARKRFARLIMVAEMQGRDLLRRRLALILLIVLPLAFYAALTTSDRHQAVIPGGIAIAFAVGGASIFSVLSSRQADQRLVLAGFGPWELVAGRLMFLEVLGLPVAGASAAVMAAVSSPEHPWMLGLAVWLVAFIAVPFGLTIGTLVPQELEATLVLIGVVGIQLSLSGNAVVARVLPFWGARRLIDVALGGSFSIPRLILACMAYAALLFALSLILMTGRLRVRRPVPMPGVPWGSA
ncbi:MAG TPA: hypothetical protein VGH10_13410 [Actinomycetota bacterium]|jgi:hypothetical protein